MGLPVISVAQMREWEEATWASGVTEAEVIQKVGARVAERAASFASKDQPILILAGKGHNGDDARAAAEWISTHTKSKAICLSIHDPIVALSDSRLQSLTGISLIVDGLFGIGINRPLDEGWQRLIHRINESNVPVLSIDTPSGLDADTGAIQGACIRADITLTVGAPKRGLLTSRAVEWVGRLEVADHVGFVPCPCESDVSWTMPEDFIHFPPVRKVSTHKGTNGHVAIFAGSLGYHGAAVLAARGAMRARPGLVTLFTRENVYIPVAAQLQAAMVHPWTGNSKLPESTTAIVFGPGLAEAGFPEELKNFLRDLWKNSPLPVVADASALEWLATTEINSRAVRVITPHPGEAARLLQQTAATVQEDRSASLRKLSRLYSNCWVVLKGHQTIIGQSDGPIFVNSSGNPYLAQGGSGDVLAGFLGGLLAQPALQGEVAKTIRFAVWEHGACADRLEQNTPNWTIEELLRELKSLRTRCGL